MSLSISLYMLLIKEIPEVNEKPIPQKKRKKGNFRRKKKNIETMANSLDAHVQNKSKTLAVNEKTKVQVKNAVSNKPVASEKLKHQTRVVKYYSPLKLYVNLHMEPAELYFRLHPYVLPLAEMKRNGFPCYSESIPGKVIIQPRFRPEPSDDKCQRVCCRCGGRYRITEDGVYQSDTICQYHWGKRVNASPYSCCNQYTLTGCMTSKHHISISNEPIDSSKYVCTKPKRMKKGQSSIYALDCEMCYTMNGMQIARVSVVGLDGLTIYDSYVKPEDPILDYNTAFSGITASDLQNVTTTLADVQAVLLRLFNSQTLLIGHGLENDLRALCLIHEMIVDTSVVFPHHNGFPYKRSLKALLASVLEHEIQEEPCGHDSVEDARAAIELMLWKVNADNQTYMQLQQGLLHIPVTQQWTVTPLRFTTAVVPYTIGYWAPPVSGPTAIV